MPKKPPASEAEQARKKKTQVLLDPIIARKIGIITAAQDVTIQDWVNNRLSELVDVHLAAAMDAMGLDVRPKK